jgi:hypothetical protein
MKKAEEVFNKNMTPEQREEARKGGQHLIDSWCEINGGGVVTPDQLEAVKQVEEEWPELTDEQMNKLQRIAWEQMGIIINEDMTDDEIKAIFELSWKTVEGPGW